MSREGKTWKLTRPTKFDTDGTWERAVKFFLGHKLNIERCLIVRFALAGQSKVDSVWPNTLASPKYLEDYLKASEGQVEDLQIALNVERAICRNYLLGIEGDNDPNTTTVLRRAITSKQLNLSPLFRYCLAKEVNFVDLARRFYRAAKEQYLCAPEEYREVWKNGLPADFVTRVEQQTGG